MKDKMITVYLNKKGENPETVEEDSHVSVFKNICGISCATPSYRVNDQEVSDDHTLKECDVVKIMIPAENIVVRTPTDCCAKCENKIPGICEKC